MREFVNSFPVHENFLNSPTDSLALDSFPGGVYMRQVLVQVRLGLKESATLWTHML